jgi:hypothetical protein
MAARLGEENGSSTAMLLMRHDLDIGGRHLRFFTLLAHLAPQAVSSSSPSPGSASWCAWATSRPWARW